MAPVISNGVETMEQGLTRSLVPPEAIPPFAIRREGGQEIDVIGQAVVQGAGRLADV